MLGINSIALLNRTVNVAPDVMGKLRDLLDREVDRHDREWMETMQRLTVVEKTEKRPVIICSRGVERDCRLIVNQLLNSMPKNFLFRVKSRRSQGQVDIQLHEKSTFHGCKRRVRAELRLFNWGRDNVWGVRHFRARTGRLVRGDNVGTTKGQNVVRGAGFKATKGQSFFGGVEKRHKQIGT